jgi:pimeloyl-ACP methyl ester carboxylesterase
MPASSSLARLLQALVVVIVAGALLWGTAWWPRHPGLAVGGALCIVFVHAIVLGFEFLLLRPASQGDTAPRPTAGELVVAWWREVVAGLCVFGWRQPFAWRRWPDRFQASPGATGLVFVHGFVCNRGFWSPWLQLATARGHPFAAVNLEPVFGDIDRYVATIEAAVQRITAVTGKPPVLVCHSMGGLAARAWSKRHAGGARVAHTVTIGSPHRGTWLAKFGHAASGRQMRVGSAWLTELADGEPPAQGRYTCWYSNCDNVVFPPSTATLAGADNRLLRGAAHVELAFRPEIMEYTFALARGN